MYLFKSSTDSPSARPRMNSDHASPRLLVPRLAEPISLVPGSA